jgi:hypothetical protein
MRTGFVLDSVEPDPRKKSMDISTIGAALGSVKTIFDLMKTTNDLQLAVKVNSEVANIQGQLITLQQLTLGLQDENQKLKAEIALAKAYTYHHSVSWKKLEDGKEDGPFCPTCLGDGKEMRLQLRPHVDQSGDYLFVWCPKLHIDPRGKQQTWTPKEESRYKIPRDLVAENYFA